MRCLLGPAIAIAALLAAAPAHAERSNPAFLGISWDDLPSGPCEVKEVIADSPAEAADVRATDQVRAFDGVPIPTCQVLTMMIVSHMPGDSVRLDLWRDNRHVVTTAVLSTRSSIANLRVGKMLEDAVQDYDDGSELNLRDLRGQTTILAWADHLGHCDDCGALIRRVGDRVQERGGAATAPQVVAVAKVKGSNELADLQALHLYLGMRLLVMQVIDGVERSALDEYNRVYFMVLDRTGVVRFIAPISPDDDAADAAIDDVLAAAEQAERAPTSR